MRSYDSNYNTICLDCRAKFDSSICGQICPACSSVNLTTYVSDENTSTFEPKQVSTPKEKKEYIIYYYKFGMFKVMHKDSHFYNHTQNLNELSDPNNGIRYYTADGAKKAIDKMKENSPDWDLRAQKILNL